MKYTDNSMNLLTANSYKGVGKGWIVQNLKGSESVETIVSLLNDKIEKETTVSEFERLRKQIEIRLLQKLAGFCDGFVALGDQNFPQYRGGVKDSERPVFLFFKGDISLLNIENKNISVIGLLNPGGDIEERERKIVAAFVKHGATIVSGLALGCDSISHQQALESKGKTVAILSCPLSSIIPTRNRGLAYQIAKEGGLLVSEYGSDFKNLPELTRRYKERDRLQALFCNAMVLTAGYARNTAELRKIPGPKPDSGALLAMGYAKQYKIPRAVMYDNLSDENNPMFDLNRDLISEKNDITVIGQHNVPETVAKIMMQKPEVKTRKPSEKSL